MNNKEIVAQFVTAFNAADIEAIAELSTPEITQRMEQSIEWTKSKWGEHNIELTEVVSEGDTVAARIATKGGHVGEFMGIAPTGKQWTNNGVIFYYLKDGKVVDVWSMFNTQNHVEQLGYRLTPTEID